MSLYRIYRRLSVPRRIECVIRSGVLLGRCGDGNTGRLSALNQKDKRSKPGNLPKSNALLEIGENWIAKILSLLRRTGFSPSSVRVGFVVHKVALRQVFLQYLSFPVSIIPPMLHTNFPIHAALTRRRLATGWTVRGSNPGENEIFRPSPDRPWGPPSLLYNGFRVIPGDKTAGPWR